MLSFSILKWTKGGQQIIEIERKKDKKGNQVG